MTVLDQLRVRDATPRGIAAELARLINDGDIAPGARLPTVRQVAAALGVSPATVSSAWQALARAGLIASRGRAGSFVREERQEWMTPRVHDLSVHPGALRLDLSSGIPDAALLPDVSGAFSRVSGRVFTGRYHESPVLPELGDVLRESWPAQAEALTVVDGALDGVSRVLEQVVRFGDRVVVESPGFPYFFDLVDALGAQVVPVRMDAEGIDPSSLSRALAARPAALVLQPRAHNPTGVSMSADRAAEIVRLIRAARDGRRLVIVEDDHSGLISTAADVTLAQWLPDQVVHVRSFSKSHGPDLRIAALAGPSRIVDRVVARRLLGPGWTSRTIQAVLLDLLCDPAAIAAVARARDTYAARQQRIAASLRAKGIAVPVGDGVNVAWRVGDERGALVRLAASGIAVAAGSAFVVAGGDDEPFIRATVGLVPQEAPWVADAVSRAVTG